MTTPCHTCTQRELFFFLLSENRLNKHSDVALVLSKLKVRQTLVHLLEILIFTLNNFSLIKDGAIKW